MGDRKKHHPAVQFQESLSQAGAEPHGKDWPSERSYTCLDPTSSRLPSCSILAGGREGRAWPQHKPQSVAADDYPPTTPYSRFFWKEV